MRILLILAFVVVGVLIVRMMRNASFDPDEPAESHRPEPKRRSKKSKRKHKSRSHSKPKEPWVRPPEKEYIPGQPVEACPNLKNEFHQCSGYCFQRWGQRPPEIIAMDN